MIVKSAYRRVREVASSLPHYSKFRQARRELCSTDLTTPETRLLQQVSLKVNPWDPMYGPDDSALDYLTAGLSASRCIRAALNAAGRTKPIESVLDFPCGYGRVLRFLKVMFPNASIVGGEVNPDMLDFCRRTFSVETVVSKGDFEQLDFGRRFDFIWCGSLVTHLNEKSTAALLGFFYRHLKDGGTCVFTTHGEFIVRSLRSKKLEFRLAPESYDDIVQNFDRHGFGFADYEHTSGGWGISATSHSRISEMARNAGTWKETLFLDKGWHNFQDVYAFTRPAARQAVFYFLRSGNSGYELSKNPFSDGGQFVVPSPDTH